MKSNFVNPIELNQRLNRPLVLSSRQLGWNGILVEQYQHSPTPVEVELPALSDHLLKVSGNPVRVAQGCDDRLHSSISAERNSEGTVQPGDSIFVPAGQPSYWRCQGSTASRSLHIYLKPSLVAQVARAAEIAQDRINLRCFSEHDPRLHQMAMLFLAELKSSGMMGRLYVESLSQALVIYLLRHYSTLTQEDPSQNSGLTQTQIQQVTDYIRTHLSHELSLAELASVINISPTYFAGLFKQAMGIPPHQYVIGQRVEQAKLMLSKTDLAIADIALQVGFSSQSHLTQQFKRLTGITPKQVR